jgi:hypothetical protein
VFDRDHTLVIDLQIASMEFPGITMDDAPVNQRERWNLEWERGWTSEFGTKDAYLEYQFKYWAHDEAQRNYREARAAAARAAAQAEAQAIDEARALEYRKVEAVEQANKVAFMQLELASRHNSRQPPGSGVIQEWSNGEWVPVSRAAIEAPRAGWLANSVTADAWDDDTPPTPPTICMIEGTAGALFAAGRTSRIYGKTGSAKSFIAKLGVKEILEADGSVLYLDGDGIWEDFKSHLKAMGVSRDNVLSGRLHHSHIEGTMLGEDFQELLQSQPWGFIVVDGFNVALNQSGFKGSEDDGVNAFFARVLNPAAATGAAVLVVDHVKKDGVTDHGSVFKSNDLTGIDLGIQRLSAIAPGIMGYSSIKLTQKDRVGWATALQSSRGRTQDQAFAHVVVDSTGGSGVPTVVSIQLDPPTNVTTSSTTARTNGDADTLRNLLKDNPAGFASTNRVIEALKLRNKSMDATRVNNAAAALVATGEAMRTQIGQSLDLRPVVKGTKP